MHLPYRPIKIQIISRYLPLENTAGNATYLLNIMQYLHQAGCELQLLIAGPIYEKPEIPSSIQNVAQVSFRKESQAASVKSASQTLTIKFKMFVRSFIPAWFLYGLKKGKRYFYEHVADDASRWDALPTRAEKDFVNARSVEFKPDVIIVNYVFLIDTVENAFENPPLKVVLTHDIRHQRVQNYTHAGLLSQDSHWTWENESELLRKADILLAIQENDAKTLKKMASNKEVFCIPMSAVYTFHSPAEQVPGRCLFVGSKVDHNIHGLRWFLQYVWPGILHSLPNSTLHVCGTICERFEKGEPTVRFLGQRDDLTSEYAAAELCIIPLIAGSGLKIKLVEALSHGRACVSTPVGVQGVQELSDKAVLVAESPEDFADAVLRVLQTPAKRQAMEREAKQYVTEVLSPEKAYQPFVERIKQHFNQQREHRPPYQ